MPQLKIYIADAVSVIDISCGTLLLDALRSEGFAMYSPCRGTGRCGKCMVYVRGEGYVTACMYRVVQDSSVVLPGTSEALILDSQYRYTRNLPLDPGPAVFLSGKPFGVAIDIGTTTLVFYLTDLSTGSLIETRSQLNPQSGFGADVISRINYCILNPEGTEKLQSVLLGSLNDQFIHFAGKFGLAFDNIVKICVTGNTTMLHLLLGINPGPLALVPFRPVFTGQKILKAEKYSLKTNPEAEMKLLPSLSAYIGADVVAGIGSLNPSKEHRNSLYIDIGTNGEIAVMTPGRIFCCSAAAGPAFEGANIKHGMGAVEGAINEYTEQGEYHTIGNGKPLGYCGSGLIDIVAYLLKTGIADKEGFMAEEFVVVPNDISGTFTDISITPGDIREFQLAKSAIVTGINILLKNAGLTYDDIDAVYLAGGFGNYIRRESAAVTGLIPAILAEKLIHAGNTSGTAALLAVRSVIFDEVIRDILSQMVYVELSNDPDFATEFAMNMSFP